MEYLIFIFIFYFVNFVNTIEEGRRVSEDLNKYVFKKKK